VRKAFIDKAPSLHDIIEVGPWPFAICHISLIDDPYDKLILAQGRADPVIILLVR